MKVPVPTHKLPNGYTLKATKDDVCEYCKKTSRLNHFFSKNTSRGVKWMCYKCAKAKLVI